MRRGSGRGAGVVAAVLTGVLLLAVLVWASGSGDALVATPTGAWELPTVSGPTVSPEAPTTARATLGTAPEHRPRPGGSFPWETILGAVLLALLVGAVLRWLLRPREHVPPEPPREDEALLELLEATGEEVRYRALREGDPRNAVVACWVAVEEAVQRAGLTRDPSETAAELTERVLARWQVDRRAIADLSEAYREARFSQHPITEDQRHAAVDALGRINQDLRRAASAPVPDAPTAGGTS